MNDGLNHNIHKIFEFHFKNFGPIIDGILKIDNFTIIHGENNAGKSYSAMFAYYFIKLIKKELKIPINPDPKIFKMLSEQIDNIDKLDSEEKLENKIYPLIIKDIFLYSMNISKDLTNIFYDIYGCSPDKLISIGKRKAEISVKYGSFKMEIAIRRVEKNDYHISINFRVDQNVFNGIRLKRIESPLKKGLMNYAKTDFIIDNNDSNLIMFDEKVDKKRLLLYLYNLCIEYLNKIFKSDYNCNVIYLPASRTGIIQLIRPKMLVSLLSSTNNINGAPYSPKLPKVIIDFIETLFLSDELEYMENTSQDKNNNSKIINEKSFQTAVSYFEENIMGGEIERKKVKDNFFSYLLHFHKDLLHYPSQTSSLITEVLPIIALMKYTLRKGDIIFIEEPEAHLNLSNQWDMAKLLALSVKFGISIIIITHSYLILERIQNFILARKLLKNANGTTKQDYANNIIDLDPNNLKINYFQKAEKNSDKTSENKDKIDNKMYKIIQTDVSDDGIDFSNYHNILERIGNEYHEIMDKIESNMKEENNEK